LTQGAIDLDPHPVDLALVDGELFGQVHVAVHDGGHELHRVVRLQPRGLVADHGIGGGVGLVEAVVGELVEEVPDLQRLGLIDAVLGRALQELGPFGIHRLLDLLAHGAAQQVGAAKRIARHLLRDLHHLFLVDDDALRLVEDVIDGGVQVVPLAQPVLHLAVFRDVLHRAGPVERDERHDILDAGGLHLHQRRHHARAFHLEHRDGLGRRIDLVGRRIVERDGVDLVLGPLGPARRSRCRPRPRAAAAPARGSGRWRSG
jgi:hypothetical protein